MKYFLIHVYGSKIKIDETELPKALMAQITGKVVTLKNCAVRGNSISLIEPDYRRVMGWNDEYKLTPEDYAEINGSCKEYEGAIDLAKVEARKMLENDGGKFLLN